MSRIDDHDFVMTEGDRHNPLWVKLVAHFETMLRDARGKNDGPLPEQETARIRGRIGCLRDLIALGDEPPRDG